MRRRSRKHLRRLEAVYDTSRAPLFYITCCVRERKKVLADAKAVSVLEAAWCVSPSLHGWQVGRYVVMPDHVHFFASPVGDGGKTLSGFMGDWKRWTARRIRAEVLPGFEWQKEFFDRLLRSDESYESKWEYVRDNPVRGGLVARADEWPYRGELNVLEW